MKVVSQEIKELYYVECFYDYQSPYYKHYSETIEELLEKINNDIAIHNKEIMEDGDLSFLLEPLTKVSVDDSIVTGSINDVEIVCKNNFVVLEFDDGSTRYVLL